MKRILAFIVSFVLLIACGAAALAEADMDFSGYTLDELIAIKAALSEEIAKYPGGEKLTLGAGQYKIGEDLPAGVYAFRFVQNGDSDVDRTDYYVYENEAMLKYDIDRMWLGDMPRLENSLKGDGQTRITLYPGECLYLSYNGAELERVDNVPERVSDYTPPTGTLIPKGEYTVGNEIPAGSYNIYYSGTGSSRVRVFQDAKEAGNMFNDGKETILSDANREGAVTLAEGNVIRVEYTAIIMTKGGGFTFD
ncbi:MAG: hypothetical protein E7317_02560 [Clostridiales bacterium]|nr:hypothetical protein [Clostridiales bacterium]